MKITIIIPVYNKAKEVSECLDSVLRQTLSDFEILCVNDGSKDNSLEILQSYQKKDDRIVVIDQKNKGAALARNAALDVAQGEFVYFLDGDDVLPDDKVLEDLYRGAVEHDVLICGGSMREHNLNGYKESWEGEDQFYGYTFKEDKLWDYQDWQFDFGFTRFIYHRDLIGTTRFKNRKYYEDPVFFVEMMHKAGKFYALKRCSYEYNVGKAILFSYRQAIDLTKGVKEILTIAKNHGYDHLFGLELYRYTNDYAEHVVQFVGRPQSTQLRKEIQELDALIDGDVSIVYQLYARKVKYLDERLEDAWKYAHQLEDEKNHANQEIEQLHREVDRLRSDVNQRDEFVWARDKVIDSMKGSIHALESDIRQRDETVWQRDKVIDDLKVEVNELNQTINQQNQHVQELEQKIHEIYQSYNYRFGKAVLSIPKKVVHIVKPKKE